MSYSISCVLLIPGQYRDQINVLAESLGYGPDNLSVLLTDADGAEWWGCHTWCVQAFLDQLEDPQHESEVLSALIVSAVPDGVPLDNWRHALELNGLVQATDPE